MTTSSYLDLLRHGEPQGGAYYRGITNDSLTPFGWEQMHKKIAEQMNNWDVIISSPLSRCYAFAEILSQQLQLPLVNIPQLQEINFGDWEGQSATHINSELLTQFYTDPFAYTPPNGEYFGDFQRRVLNQWQNILKKHEGDRLLIITHAGVIRVILADLLNIDLQHSFRLKIPHACLSRIECFHSLDAENFLQLISHG